MQLTIWQIAGRGFHFGRRGLEQEESGYHLPSDSLLAALIARWVELLGAPVAMALVEQLQQDPPPFVLSSAFPRAGEVKFFPVPLSHPTKMPRTGPRPKDLKRIKYVSEQLFRASVRGDSLSEMVDASRPLQGGSILVAKDEWDRLPKAVKEDGRIWNVEKRPRVTIDRGAQSSNLYFTGRTAFNDQCGLWFGVRWLKEDAELAQILAAGLADLADAGIGGDRTSGFGASSIEQHGVLELPDADRNAWVTLSRYLPRPDEIGALQHARSAYAVETIGGWIDSPVSKAERRIPVRLLAEGAVLGPLDRLVPGQIVDVQPDYKGSRPLGHAVYRSGLALAVGLDAGG
jgi:CRISPR-associated protein Csm4